MKRLVLALLAASAASPAWAQHSGHAPTPPPVDPHAGHTMPSPGRPAPPATDPHAGHGMPTAPQPQAAPHIHQPAAPAAPPVADPHAGHDRRPGQAGDPHAGHDMGHAAAPPPAPPVQPPPAAAFSGPEHAADAVFGAGRMQPSRRDLIRSHGGMTTQRFRLDRLEIGTSGDGDTYAWDADFFYGGPLDRLWLKSEGEGGFGGALEHGEVQVLWSHAIAPFFDLQAGLRYDFAPDPDRAHLVLGVQGLAPYRIEVDAALFLSTEGELTARIEAEHDIFITQRLILQPRVEIDVAAQDIPERGIAGGLSSAEAGLRLRYEVRPEFAPYVGVQLERTFRPTGAGRGRDEHDQGGLSLVAGIRIWF